MSATKTSQPSSADLNDAIALSGRELASRSILYHQTLVGRFGLNATDHKCLDITRNEGPVTAGRLAELTGLTTGAITVMLDRLEKARFIKRSRDPNDRRKVVVKLTDDANRKLAPLFEPLQRAMKSLHTGYSVEQLATILDYQRKGIQILREATDKMRNVRKK